MVSLRCKLIVKDLLNNMGIRYDVINLGYVQLSEPITEAQKNEIRNFLPQYGLELMEDAKAILIERIKNIIIEMIHYDEDPPAVKYSVFISEKLNHSYTYLANLFSETQGITIEHFIILQKIEKVKELILYNELTLTEIAYKMNYSSVAHLSNQFKKITGLTPSFFRSIRNKKRNNLEDL